MARYQVIFTLQGDVEDTQNTVACSEDQPLLDAIAALNLPVRKACRNGVCGVCKCILRSGDISYQGRLPHGLWQKHIDAGYILPCIASPCSDVELTGVRLEPG
jgi:ferredoxin